MIERKLIIQNKFGLHARPAALFVEVAARYNANVTISKEGVEVNGKSIMGILMLAAEKGHEVILRVDGREEEALLQALVDLLEGKLDDE